MLKCHTENNSFYANRRSSSLTMGLDSIIPIESIEDENFSTKTNSNKSNKIQRRIRKRSNDICYTLSYYEKYGNIYVSTNTTKIFVAKIKTVDFDDNYQELFEKGKNNMGNYFKEDINSIPDITFWYQRYYYYRRFDEGIKMDYECWWSVTPEELAIYIASICRGKIVADGFCGSGGNVIQFSKYCNKVYAIDIDPNKIEICKNNTQVYQCEDNIEFILSDYLMMENKIKVDYVFLSPPWGGTKYKESDIYNIKELITPNIYDIIKVSLNISRNIIFYLPRTLLLEELFEILSTMLNLQDTGKGNRIFLDVHILKSEKKIKALLIIFGHDIKDIESSDLSEYLNHYYPNISQRNLEILSTISKIVGNYKFLQTEFYLRRQNKIDNNSFYFEDPNILIKYFYNVVMTEHEKIKLQSLNILKNGVMSKHNKSNKYKKNYSSVLFLPRQLQYTPSNTSITNFLKIEENELNSESIEIYSKLKYHSINKYDLVSKGNTFSFEVCRRKISLDERMKEKYNLELICVENI